MTLRINTNVSALNAHKNLVKNDSSLSASLEKLSSGLRINRAADDASGMAIADSLKSQSLGLGQAIRNANDGISMVQTADGALEESINIVNTIKTKAIQAAQDGQTTESRKAIQADIDKLMAELDNIAKTTSFNGQKLLSGVFTNKAFQVGAYSGETVGISIGSSESTKTGHLTTANLTADSTGEVRLSITSSIQDTTVKIKSVTLGYDNDPNSGMGALADAINAVSDSTGVTAQASVKSTSTNAVAAGSTGSDFAINGVVIGAVTVEANDDNGALVNAINTKSDQHGVTASVDASGYLTLTASDGRAIQVTGDTGAVLLGSDMSTLGSIKLFQIGANEIKISDEAEVVSLNTSANVALSAAATTTVDSTLAKGTVIGSASTLKAGSEMGFTLTTNNLDGNVTTTLDSTLTAGSVLASGSTIKSGSVVGGSVDLKSNVTTTTDSYLAVGTVIGSGATLKKGTQVTTTFEANGNTYSAGTTLQSDVTLSTNGVTLTAELTAKAGSTITSNSTIAGGSSVGGDLVTSGANTMTVATTLKAGSVITDDTSLSIKSGSVIGGDVTISATVVTASRDMALKTGSTLKATSELAKGSTIGGNVTVSKTATLAGTMTLAAGSQLAAGSIIKAGTVINTDIWTTGGNLLKAGTVLEGDAITSGTNYLNNSQSLVLGSTLASGSVLAASQTAASGSSATTTVGDVEKFTLSDVDVTSQDSAQVAISIADSALKNLDKVRSGLGSTQNQLTSTIANISVTKVNISSAESAIRDVDFAEESSNFSKMQILTQASTFALAQANASAQNVMSLLQG